MSAMTNLDRLKATGCPRLCDCRLNDDGQCVIKWATDEIERLRAEIEVIAYHSNACVAAAKAIVERHEH